MKVLGLLALLALAGPAYGQKVDTFYVELESIPIVDSADMRLVQMTYDPAQVTVHEEWFDYILDQHEGVPYLLRWNSRAYLYDLAARHREQVYSPWSP